MKLRDQDIDFLLDALRTVVDAEGPWRDKRDAVKARLSADDNAVLEEFIGWWEGDLDE